MLRCDHEVYSRNGCFQLARLSHGFVVAYMRGIGLKAKNILNFINLYII